MVTGGSCGDSRCENNGCMREAQGRTCDAPLSELDRLLDQRDALDATIAALQKARAEVHQQVKNACPHAEELHHSWSISYGRTEYGCFGSTQLEPDRRTDFISCTLCSTIVAEWGDYTTHTHVTSDINALRARVRKCVDINDIYRAGKVGVCIACGTAQLAT